jgi:SepF-like predicted cell division protein (DUF552 family)
VQCMVRSSLGGGAVAVAVAENMTKFPRAEQGNVVLVPFSPIGRQRQRAFLSVLRKCRKLARALYEVR